MSVLRSSRAYRSCRAAVVVSLVAAVLAFAPSSVAGATDDAEDLGSAVLAEVVAEAFPELGLTAEQVLAYLDAGHGFGEVVIAASLAVASGQTIDAILDMKSSGLGWGEISDSLGLGIRGFGRFVSAVLGGRKGEEDPTGEELSEACARTMAAWRFGLEESQTNGLMLGYGLRAQEVLAVAAMVGSSGEATRLAEALRIMAETHQCAAVGKRLGLTTEKWTRIGDRARKAGEQAGQAQDQTDQAQDQTDQAQDQTDHGQGKGQGKGQGDSEQVQGGGQGQGSGSAGSGGSGKGSKGSGGSQGE